MRKAFAIMLIVALVLAINLAADPTPPPAQKRAEGMPEHFETYGKERSQQFFSWCVQAGEDRFTQKSMESYCSCHVYLMEEVIPFPELEKLSKEARSDLFSEIANGCKQLGQTPVLKPKAKPRAPTFDPKSIPLGGVET